MNFMDFLLFSGAIYSSTIMGEKDNEESRYPFLYILLFSSKEPHKLRKEQEHTIYT